MKTYNLTKRISKQARQVIENTIATNAKYRNAYFWTPYGNASSRRKSEAIFAKNNPPYKLITNRGVIEVRMSYSESCKNVYYSLEVIKNYKGSNVTILKNLIK